MILREKKYTILSESKQYMHNISIGQYCKAKSNFKSILAAIFFTESVNTWEKSIALITDKIFKLLNLYVEDKRSDSKINTALTKTFVAGRFLYNF